LCDCEVLFTGRSNSLSRRTLYVCDIATPQKT
jgi:hypothetical protein